MTGALQDAAAAGSAEASSLRSMAEDYRQRAAKLSEAAQTMEAIEVDEKALAAADTAGQSVSQRLAALLTRRNMKLEDVVQVRLPHGAVPAAGSRVQRVRARPWRSVYACPNAATIAHNRLEMGWRRAHAE